MAPFASDDVGRLGGQTRAKINLSLTITGRRADGYHTLHSLVCFADVGDVLEVRAVDDGELRLICTGAFAHAVPTSDGNLVLRAASALRAACGIRAGAHLTLEKRLPTASGIGGGSGDAALALRLLNQLWGCGLSVDELARIALPLGADVPVCVHGQACVMEGIGEQLTPLAHPLPPLHLLLVTPPVAVPTAEIFAAYAREAAGRYASAPVLPERLDVEAIAQMRNDLEPYAIAREPVIGEVLEGLRALPGCIAARMSGSGATCVGMFAKDIDALVASEEVRQCHPQSWIHIALAP